MFKCIRKGLFRPFLFPFINQTMQPFQTDIITRKKLIQIRGKITSAEQPTAQFLKHYQEGYEGIFKNITSSLSYTGNELKTSLLCSLAIISCQIYSLFAFSSYIAYELSIVLTTFYTLTFCCLLNIKRQLVVQLICLVISASLAVLTVVLGILDSYVVFGVFFSLLFCFLGRSVLALQQSYFKQEVTALFSFESNLIIGQYLFWKGYQITLAYLNLYALNFSSLVLFLIVLTIINSLKTWNIFDFEIIKIIKLFEQNQERVEEDQKENSMVASQSISVFVKQDNAQEEKSFPEDKVKDNSEEPNIIEEEGTNKEPNNSELKLQHQDLSACSDRDSKEKNNHHQSSKRAVVVSLSFAISVTVTLLAIFKCNSESSSTFKTHILYYLSALFRTTLLLMTCEYQKTLTSQAKDPLNYILVFICDTFWVILSGFFMQGPSLLSLSIESSMTMSVSPLLVIKLFNYFNKAVHAKLDNGRYTSLFVMFVLPLQVRQVFIVQGLQQIVYTIDGIILGYSLLVLLVFSCKEEIIYFVLEVKTLLSSKKNRLKIFQKLKKAKFQYQNIVQNYLFFHVFFMNLLYYFISGPSTIIQGIYYIIYLSPILLYSLALSNCHRYQSDLPQTYLPSLGSVTALVGAFSYLGIAYCGVLTSSNHQNWSAVVILNVLLFVVTLEGEKLAVIYLCSYFNFLRAFIISTFSFLIYFPFIVCFCCGYFLESFSDDYLYYYVVGGFLYIWVIITVIGLATHWILNLTEKSKKELFIVQYMQGEMKKINMKENLQKILMMSNMYELLNYNSEDLLNYLKNEKHMTLAIRKEKEYQHDYQLLEPEEKDRRRLSIVAKPIDAFDMARLLMRTGGQENGGREEGEEQDNNNPVLNFFKDKDRNRIEIVAPVDVNDNYVEIKRLASRLENIPTVMKKIEATQTYKQIQGSSSEEIGQLIAKLFVFLSEPSKTISRNTFRAFLKILAKEQMSQLQADKFYQKFSHNSLMDEYKFKNFILDYVNFKYEHYSNNFHTSLRTFACREIAPLLLSNFEPIKYYLYRKKIIISEESRQIWIHDKTNEDANAEFTLIKVKEQRKKAHLLKREKKERKTIAVQEEEGPSQDGDRGQVRMASVKVDKKELKDKSFLKPENVYSMLVNALIECYIYYQKQSENFKIKSIKLNLSNALELFIKVNDIVFVFGFTTIYVFIAYYQQNYESSKPFLSYLNYPVLLILASALVLAYIVLIMYHKTDFETGSLGLDENHRSLDFKNFKFWTKTIMFMLGSGLANYVIAIGLNSWICDSTNDTLFNFTDVSCYTKVQYGYMLVGLMILVIYWPLSVITYPFNTAMDRNLEIKYKKEYQVLYLQVKFMINGFNTLLNPYPYQTEELIGSILKVVLCSILAIFYYRMQPCSYQLLNMIQGKIYILLAILSFAGALCYFIGLLYSVVATGSLLLIYLIYFIYATFKSFSQLKNDNEDGQIVDDIIKNQKIKIEIIRQNNEGNLEDKHEGNREDNHEEEPSAANLRKVKPTLANGRNPNHHQQSREGIPSQTIYYNNSLQIVGSSQTGGSHYF